MAVTSTVVNVDLDVVDFVAVVFFVVVVLVGVLVVFFVVVVLVIVLLVGITLLPKVVFFCSPSFSLVPCRINFQLCRVPDPE